MNVSIAIPLTSAGGRGVGVLVGVGVSEGVGVTVGVCVPATGASAIGAVGADRGSDGGMINICPLLMMPESVKPLAIIISSIDTP